MKNEGHCPPHDRVDIKYRNGAIRRSVDPRKYRWKPWDWGESAFDIEDWQPSTGGGS